MHKQLFLTAFFVVFSVQLAFTQWSIDPSVNTLIASPRPSLFLGTNTGDLDGNTLFVWAGVHTFSLDIFAQRTTPTGGELFPPGGVTVCNANNDQVTPVGISIGASAVVAWRDLRSDGSGDIYAQKIGPTGVGLWTPNGVAICAAAGAQYTPQIVSDSAGGAIITWEDYRNGSSEIYMQRINSSGVVQWATNGISPASRRGQQYRPVIVPDGVGGAVCAWDDSLGDDIHIYSQRVNAAGLLQWAANGVDIGGAVGPCSIVGDGQGGAIIVHERSRDRITTDIYAQRVNSAGNIQWAVDGVPICVAVGNQRLPVCQPGDNGSVIATWEDFRGGYTSDIYAQRVNASGQVQWSPNGISVCLVGDDQRVPECQPGGDGGVIITWQDRRSGTELDIYGQRVLPTGELAWTSAAVGGRPISTAPGNQTGAVLSPDGAGGIIAAWLDDRDSVGLYGLYAQRIDRNGYLGTVAPEIADLVDVINDQGGKLKLTWNRSYLDALPADGIDNYLIFRGTPASFASHGTAVVSKDEYLRRVQTKDDVSGLSFGAGYSPNSPDEIYYELVATVPAFHLPGYSYFITTLSDSGLQGIPWYFAMVMAQSTGGEYFESLPDSAYSIDNIPPGAIPNVAQPVVTDSSVLLSWEGVDDADLAGYAVYRGDEAGFPLDENSHLATTPDTFYVDSDLTASLVSSFRHYYRIAPRDIHGNEGEPTDEILASQSEVLSFGVNASWNLVSVPLTVEDYNKTTLFPTATTQAFAYQGTYTPQSALGNGRGYWLKFASAQDINMTGYERGTEAIPVTQGWNLIGSITDPVTATTITSTPPGIVTSQFFGYIGAGGYSSASTIQPGKGYWVKVNQDGSLILASTIPDAAHRIRIVPTNEQPPSPPEGEISNPKSQIPTDFALAQNYPNPFNPSTIVNFQLPVDNWVTMKVYNLLGEEVATLIDGFQEAGYKNVGWNALNVSTGTYFLKLRAGNFTAVRKMLVAK